MERLWSEDPQLTHNFKHFDSADFWGNRVPESTAHFYVTLLCKLLPNRDKVCQCYRSLKNMCRLQHVRLATKLASLLPDKPTRWERYCDWLVLACFRPATMLAISLWFCSYSTSRQKGLPGLKKKKTGEKEGRESWERSAQMTRWSGKWRGGRQDWKRILMVLSFQHPEGESW